MEQPASSSGSAQVAEPPSPSATASTSSNPFRNALHKFQQKKKDKAGLASAATAGFFSRSNKGAHSKNQPLPGSVKQVCGGQLPPVWATPPPPPPRKVSSPGDGLSRSIGDLDAGDDDDDEDDEDDDNDALSKSLDDTYIGQAGNDRARAPSSSSSSAQQHTPQKQSMTNANAGAHSPRGSGGASTIARSATSSRNASGNLRFEQFEQLLQKDVVDLEALRKLSWGGIASEHRPTAWRLLLGYMPPKQDRRAAMLDRKRQEYRDLLQQYYYIPDTDRGSREQSTLRQILVDIPRTNADVKLFQNERVHQCMERVLYTWAIRHPASGYVQGINDLMTPFLVVFLSAYVDNPQLCDLSGVSDEWLQVVEADTYWCLTKLLDGIQDHYTFAQPGLQRMVQRMEELVHRCDADLFKHIVEKESVQFVQFAFRWMNCLLMREVPLHAIVRLWDTYLCEDSGFESFHVYVCAAILMTFGEKLKTLEFQDLVMFLQSLPTKDWAEDEIDPLLSRAFILQTYFADSPSHLT